MELIRNLLTEYEARAWFDQFGNAELTFEKVFGELNLSKNPKRDQFTYIIIDGIMFIKEKIIVRDVFGLTAQIAYLDRYAIIPQINS